MIQVCYIFFSRKSVPVSNITGKRMNGLSWNVQERLYMIQRTICKNFVSWWLTPSIQDRFFYFCESVFVSTIMVKTDERIFMKFSGKIVHETKNNLKHFRVVVINPLNSGLFFLYSESVIVSTIMEKRMNGFPWNFHDILGTAQEIIK